MIPTTLVARARRLVAALLAASVACGVAAQTAPVPAPPPAAEVIPLPAEQVPLPAQAAPLAPLGPQVAPAPPPLAVPGAPVAPRLLQLPTSEGRDAIALVLPEQQSVFGQAAEAVRLGFFAAHEAAHGKQPIQVQEVDDNAVQLQAVIGTARERGVRVVVGPLLRSSVNAVVDGGYATVPQVALNTPDREGRAPPTMIALGLSAEAEAQYVVRVALAEFVGSRRTPGSVPRFVVLAGRGALEQRIAQAYVGALRAAGEAPLVIDASAERDERLAGQLDPERHEAVFLALDAGEAALLRARIPRPLLIFGTSLLNTSGGGSSPEATARAHDLDGIRFVDMPWLLGDPSQAGNVPLPPRTLSTEMARLYALGVDAYRVAQRWSAGETRFMLDGMMGHLRVDRAQGLRVERTPALAIYRGGAIEREEIAR
jgi:hypothetical protein